MNNTTRARLDAAIRAAGIPIDGTSGEQGSVRVDVKNPAQRTQALAVVAAFDWSPAADAAANAQAAKAAAAAIFTNVATLDELRLAMYAFMQLVLDDRNMMADKVNAIGTALAAAPGTSAAVTLATIRTAVQAIPGGLAPKYTQQQLVDAIVAKINAAA